MKYVSNDGVIFKTKKDYYMYIYPELSKNRTYTAFMVYIDRFVNKDKKKLINEQCKNYNKYRYDNDDNYKQLQIQRVLKRQTILQELKRLNRIDVNIFN